MRDWAADFKAVGVIAIILQEQLRRIPRLLQLRGGYSEKIMLSRQRLLSVAALLLACLLVGRLAYAKEAIIPSLAGEPYDSGWSLQMDNDLLTPKNHDRDYTGGIAVTFAGKRVQQWPISLD